MLDHANLDAMCNGVIDAFKLTGADHSLLILPLFHVNGIVVGTLSPLLAGGRATVAGRFKPESFFDRIEQSRATYFSAVPTIYTMLCGLPASVKPDTSSVRFAICGAAPASVELLEAFESRYGIPIIEGYGLSEGSCASTVNPLDGKRKPGTVGLPLPGQTIRIVDTAGSAVPDGQPGEVVIKGPNVMRGYLNRPEETAKTVVDGWLHTGDVGRFDEDGYLVLVDRAKDMIIRGGENIYPREIEAVVHRLPQIAEAAVVGRAHPVYGEEPVLFVSLHPGQTLDADAIREHLSESLSKYKLPVEITIIDDLPKNPVGKIDKPTLRKLLSNTLKQPSPSHRKGELIMGFTKPDLPDVDPDTFLQKPLMERMRILATDWVDNGFGSPQMVHTIYIAKLVVFFYALGGILVATVTSGPSASCMFRSGGTSRSSTRRSCCGPCCWRLIGVAGSWGPLAGKVKPMTGGILFWARPGTIRLRPWKWVPFTGGDRRTWFDVVLYLALMISVAVPLFSPGVHSDSLSAAMPGNTSGLVNPALLIAPIVLLVLIGLRDKIVFLAARGEQYLPALIIFAVFSVRRHDHRAEAVDRGGVGRRRGVEVRAAFHQRHPADGQQQPVDSVQVAQAGALPRLPRRPAAVAARRLHGARPRHRRGDRRPAGPVVLDQQVGDARRGGDHGRASTCSSSRRSRWRCRWNGTCCSPTRRSSCSSASRTGTATRSRTCPRRGWRSWSRRRCCSTRSWATSGPTRCRSCRRCGSTPATGHRRCGRSRPAPRRS